MLTASNLRLRKNFSRSGNSFDIPDLIELQKNSYESFLLKDTDHDKRDGKGLDGVFRSVFPILDIANTAQLEYVSYRLSPPKYDIEECRQKGMTYSSPLKVTLRLIIFDTDEASETKNIKDMKEQEVYLGEMPLMTENGSFIINGIERVIVSQLHRSPGVFFEHDGGKGSTKGRLLFSARIIPYRGSWLDFEFDQKDILYVRIDRKRKFYVSILLKALGHSTKDILQTFYNVEQVSFSKKKIIRKIDIESMKGMRASCDIVNPKNKEVFVKTGRRITRAVVRKVQEAKISEIVLSPEDLVGKVVASPVANKKTGEVILDVNQEITTESIEQIFKAGVTKVDVIFFDKVSSGPYLRNTLLVDKINTHEEALVDIYKRLRPGEPPVEDVVKKFFKRLFFDTGSYNLGEVGRYKMNYSLYPHEEKKSKSKVLRPEDIINVIKYLIDLRNGQKDIDDVDHLGNRRVRSVGELLENQCRIGLVRMEKGIRDGMSGQDLDTMMPYDLVNAKPLTGVIREFFGSSQLSQFIDQTNPLSEITHKRRLSALGPGGLTRDRAGFEVRDVHPTHYGRICPIETPEGPNIGLISSLATYARINPFGFIETPYVKVDKGKISSRVQYMSALQEFDHYIAQAGEAVESGKFKEKNLTVRVNGEYELVSQDKVSLMDVSPSQLVSIAASLIPFLEHDDANRALMGSNMQRQAVPLIRSRSPLVGTGVEKLVAKDSGTSLVCKNDGVVESMDASRIVVRRFGKSGQLGANIDIYNLIKYQRTNQNTCFNQKPIVKKGDVVKAGDIIADGPSTELGELALGQNVLVAFTPWMGYNFEDSILISERLIKEDVYTSIHIEEFECVCRDTKLGEEEITRDIANVGEEALSHLDSTGAIFLGAEVKPGDILVGKVTPKGETQLSPEQKLLKAIFGEKAREVKDTSLRVPSGVYGTVVDVQVYSRKVAADDDRLHEIIKEKRKRFKRDLEVEENAIKNEAIDNLKKAVAGVKTTGVLLSADGSQEILKKGQVITEEDLETIPFDLLSYIPTSSSVEKTLVQTLNAAQNQLEAVRMVVNEKIDSLSKGDELPPGVIKMVKVYLAIKRKLQVGDKFAGRHGNKGVISRVVSEEDMPYLPDGTPVDMVLNPLGVPSRMNVGQILEVHLGWAARHLGRQLNHRLENFKTEEVRKALKDVYKDTSISKKVEKCNEPSLKKILKNVSEGIHIATPVFDGATEKDVKDLLERAELPFSGQSILFDGRTGEPFQNPVTVGVMYMLKLHHLVEEKIHARSIGPYSLVSQQPLGGKAQFGGQRLGEMEVWAVEAYGAAYLLQEFLTVKSDDVAGRTRMYESIVKGENILESGLPESFNVLVKELQSLALNIELVESGAFTDKAAEIRPEFE